MARNRYSGDYRLHETFGADGKVTVTTEYIGKSYRFSADEAGTKRAKKRLIAYMITAWAAFIAALIPKSSAMHTLYVALPFAFTALLLGIYTDLTLSIWKMKEPLEHRHADRINNRFPPAVLMMIFFPLVSLIGEGVHLLISGTFSFGDAVFLFGGLVIVWAGGRAFKEGKSIRAEEAVKK